MQPLLELQLQAWRLQQHLLARQRLLVRLQLLLLPALLKLLQPLCLASQPVKHFSKAWLIVVADT